MLIHVYDIEYETKENKLNYNIYIWQLSVFSGYPIGKAKIQGICRIFGDPTCLADLSEFHFPWHQIFTNCANIIIMNLAFDYVVGHLSTNN